MNVLFIHRFWRMDTLKFALRGVEKFVEYDSITLVGDIPDWWAYEAIPTEKRKDKFEDFVHNIRNYDATGDTLLMQDDIFLLKPYKPIHYYKGKLKEKAGQNKLFDNTLAMYPEINNFNTHRPIPIRKEIFDRTLSIFDVPFSNDAFCFGYPTQAAGDSKILDNKNFTYENLKDRDMFSTYNEREWMIPIFDKLGLK